MTTQRTKYAGVYRIECLVTGEVYIGGSTDVAGRFAQHRYLLRRGDHPARALQEAWARHGEDQFRLVLIARCDAASVVALEQQLIDELRPTFNGNDRASRAGSRTMVEVDGEQLSLHEIAARFALPLTTVYSRLRSGWSGADLCRPAR